MSASSSPFLMQSYRFQGSSSNIVKDHFIEKQSISRRASQQLTNMMMLKSRPKSKLFNVLKSAVIMCIIFLFYLQIQLGSSVNTLLHNLQNEVLLSKDDVANARSPQNLVQELVIGDNADTETGQMWSALSKLFVQNKPAGEGLEDLTINEEALKQLREFKKQTDKVLTEEEFNKHNVLNLNEAQVEKMFEFHSSFIADLYSKMHNLIKMYHQFFDDGKNGVVVYNSYQLNFEESIVLSRLTVDSLLKTSSSLSPSSVQVIFHRLKDEDKLNDDFMKLCALDKVECVHVKQAFTNEDGQPTPSIFNDSILKKITILFGNKFDKTLIVNSGALFLNNVDSILNSQVLNTMFWSEEHDKRLTNPLFYDITTNKNVYGHKRERVRFHKDESFKYFQLSEEDQNKPVAFHDLEDTLVDSTTDSSIVFINKKTNLDVILLSLYYDFHESLFYPLLMASTATPDEPASNAGEIFPKSSASKSLAKNSFSETLLLAAFVLNNKYYQVYKSQVAINNGFLNFNGQQDLQAVNEYYRTKLTKILPNSLELKVRTYVPNSFEDFMNKDLEILPVVLTGVDFTEIFNKEKFFKNVFDHEYYLNNNEVDPDLILSDLALSSKHIS